MPTLDRPTTPCAYCERESKPTREHLWPNGFIERVPSYNLRFSRRANKVFAGDLTIKDVCATCNNEVLGGLDAYACEMFDRYFRDFAVAGTEVLFEYDFDGLLRWLLKMSFNTARTLRPDTPLAMLRPYILGGAPFPSELLSLTLDIAPPVTPSGGQRELRPSWVRCGEAKLRNSVDWCIIRVVTIKSFNFFVLFTPDPEVAAPQEELLRVRHAIPGQPVWPDSRPVRIPVGQPSVARLHLHHYFAEGHLYDAARRR